ncbi:MAG: DinB family protein [Anaerolineales bacterium]|nr:DinB family protein [Anaerolineales bacterium]
MENTLKTAMAQQFGATIDMLEKVTMACPDQLWTVRLWEDKQLPRAAEFWYIVYHTLFWLDLYLSGSVEGFRPPPPFTLDELDPAGIIPEEPFSKEALLTYLEHGRQKCQSTIQGLTEEMARLQCRFPWGEVTFAALLLDNMRHVQEHVAQLNMILGQKADWSPGWVTRAKKATD